MRVLVAGGAGFLGSHLVDRLLADGHCVLCLDDFSTGTRDNLTPHDRLTVRQSDVRDLVGHISDLDAIFNLASPASPVAYQADPVKTITTNTQGTLNLLKLATRLQIPLVQASTSEVYGDPLSTPQVESDWGNVNPIGPRSCYDEGKRAAEAMSFAFYRRYKTKVKVARIFNTYGPRMAVEDGRVVSNFIVNALRGKPLELYGGGGQTRSFCYVSDTVDGLVRLMGANTTGPINLGNPHEITIHGLALAIQRLMGIRLAQEAAPAAEDDPTRRCPDISRAKAFLNWEPKVSLEEGLATTIAHFRKALSCPSS